LQHLNPELATKFLAEESARANFDDRFLSSCWGTLDTLLWPFLTDDVIRCFTGSDFTAEELMTGKRPCTVYVHIGDFCTTPRTGALGGFGEVKRDRELV
jgi:hypothetical protein